MNPYTNIRYVKEEIVEQSIDRVYEKFRETKEIEKILAQFWSTYEALLAEELNDIQRNNK